MRGRVLLIVMLAATAGRAQVAPSATGGFAGSQTQMMTPPPVSGAGYATEVGAEERTNYVRGGVSTATAYISNLYPGGSGPSLAETTVSVLPTVALDSTSVRQHALFTYSPGFTFYQPSSVLNEVDNTATVRYDFRLTEHATLSSSDSFRDSSLPFIPGDASAGGTVSGLPESSTPGIVPPFAKMLTNSANVELTVQTALNAMIGGYGLETEQHYPNPAQTPGLFDSSSRGGSAFLNRRISLSQYFGATYQYLDMLAGSASETFATQTHTISGYYTFYPKAKVSLSVAGGPQYFRIIETPLPAMGSWGPSVSASMGWQGMRTSFAVGYTQAVTGGGGLFGAYHSKSATATASWQMARNWIASASGAYSINKPISSLLITEEPGGHSVSGSATLVRTLGNQFSVMFEYDRLHESYEGIAAIAANPDSNRGTISIIWRFQRPLGR